MSAENESVSPPLNVEKCSLVLVDVAGTTTSIDFVKDTLFPYVIQHAEKFLTEKWDEEPTKECIQLIKGEGPDLDIPAAVEKVKALTAEQSLNKGLKTLQGLIYKEGYEKGSLKGHIFDDVAECFESWAKNRRIAIYSTGSVDAQKLVFSHSAHGDLSSHIHKYFDQSVGCKTEADSYKAIAKDVEISPEEIVFLTDSLKEATAAKTAGLTAVLIKREGNAKLPEGAEKDFMVISSFKDLGLDKVAKRKIEDQVAEEAPPSKIPKTDDTEVEKPQASKVERENGESMEIDAPVETVEEQKNEKTEKPGEIKSKSEETEKPSEKESEKTETEIKKDGDTEMKEEKIETVGEEPTKKENAQKENEETKPEVVEEKKETESVAEETPATTEEKPKEEAKQDGPVEETKAAETTEKMQTEETEAAAAETKVEEKKSEEATTEETKVAEQTSKEETKISEKTTNEVAKEKTDAVNEVQETKVVEEATKAKVGEPQTSQNKPEEKEETKVEVASPAIEESTKTEETKPAEEIKPAEEKAAENGEEKPETEEAETSNKVEEKENKSVLANGVENGKDESEIDTAGESAEVKIDDDKNDETDVKVKKLEESAESKTVSVEV